MILKTQNPCICTLYLSDLGQDVVLNCQLLLQPIDLELHIVFSFKVLHLVQVCSTQLLVVNPINLTRFLLEGEQGHIVW